MTDDLQISHDTGARRFNTRVDGHQAYVEYERAGGILTITHTIVPPEIGGRGIAAQLVRAALEYVRAEGLKVVPQCSYAAAYLKKHPQYADLVA